MGLCTTRKNSRFLKGLRAQLRRGIYEFSAPNYNLSPKYEVNAVSKTGQGIIVSCRRGPKTQKPKEYILSFSDIESVSGAARLIGRKVAWPVGKHEVRGKILALHGKNGLVRARFKKGCRAKHLEV
jgi:ribosomal protein L35AE/L33A